MEVKDKLLNEIKTNTNELMKLDYIYFNKEDKNMKVLTIKEPWATLIIDGYKKYEFRSWKLNYRGKILIHAGMSSESDMLEKFKNYDLLYSKGEIIGEAN